MILAGCGDMQSLGRNFGGPLFEREVKYLMEHEFARTAEDVLWRRSKKGLLITSEKAGDLDRWMSKRQGRQG
jgi:glycerol-3-phosphate dehydrogenase